MTNLCPLPCLASNYGCPSKGQNNGLSQGGAKPPSFYVLAFHVMDEKVPGTGHFIHHLCLCQRPLKTSHSLTQHAWEMFSVEEILPRKELPQEIRRNLTSFLQPPSFPSTPSKHITGKGKGTEEQIPETLVRIPPLSAHRREVCRAR